MKTAVALKGGGRRSLGGAEQNRQWFKQLSLVILVNVDMYISECSPHARRVRPTLHRRGGGGIETARIGQPPSVFTRHAGLTLLPPPSAYGLGKGQNWVGAH